MGEKGGRALESTRGGEAGKEMEGAGVWSDRGKKKQGRAQINMAFKSPTTKSSSNQIKSPSPDKVGTKTGNRTSDRFRLTGPAINAITG